MRQQDFSLDQRAFRPVIFVKPARPLTIALLFLTAVLAGCLGGDDAPPGDDGTDLLSEQGKGTVTGRILTVHLDPVKSGQVRLVQDNEIAAEATTRDDGSYTITNVEPGAYRLQVSAACCRENVRSVTVEADKTVEMDLQLELYSSDDLKQPRVERYDWTGFLVCSVATPAILISACSAVDLVMQELGEDNVTDDEFIHPFSVKPGLRSMVVGMEWRAPGAALGDELSIVVERNGHPDEAPEYAWAYGQSPVEFRVDAGDIESRYGDEQDQYDFKNIEDDLDLWFRIFSWGDVNLVYQQQFTVYYDLYYWEEAPEGASALPDL